MKIEALKLKPDAYAALINDTLACVEWSLTDWIQAHFGATDTPYSRFFRCRNTKMATDL